MDELEAVLEILGVNKSKDEIEESRQAYEVYKKLRDLKKEVDRKRREFRETVFELVEYETSPDNKGHYTRKFDDGLGFQKQARKSVELKEDKVKEYAKEHGLEDELLTTEKEISDKINDYLQNIS